jgi:hypothetical protein
VHEASAECLIHSRCLVFIIYYYITIVITTSKFSYRTLELVTKPQHILVRSELRAEA